jgi:hypothetical protein
VSERTRLCVRADIGTSVRPRLCIPTSLPLALPRTPSLALPGSVWTGCCVRADAARTLERIKIIKKIKINLFFGCWIEKRGKKCSVFGFQSPSSAGFAGKATRRRRLFWPSSPSHPSKLYSSLGWLNSKVPKPFFPFTLRLIDVDGF